MRPNDAELTTVLREIRDLPVYDPPADVWRGIARRLDGGRARARTWVASLVAALIAAGIVVAVATYTLGAYASSWPIERLDGTPMVARRALAGPAKLSEGEWLETDYVSRARLGIGTLGTADVGPGSRVQLVRAGGRSGALRVERGSIEATVWAPPRFFLVETPAATAIDLGCAYTLSIDARGNGTLLVRSGQVELVGRGRRSLVVAGTASQMRSGVGPGTPYAVGESQAFRDALAILDFGGGERSEALDYVISGASTPSTISLWHLLPRVALAERERVYARLSAIAPPPPGVTREAVIALDVRALGRWQDALEPSWSIERVGLLRRAWRGVWSVVQRL